MTEERQKSFSTKPKDRQSRPQSQFVDAHQQIYDNESSGDGLISAISAALKRSHKVTEANLREIAAAKAKTEAVQRAAHRLHVSKLQRWLKTRALLQEAVLDVDRAIHTHAMSLSMVDTDVHVVDVAAVHVQLAVLGRQSRAALEIVVQSDMRQTTRIVNAESYVPLSPLPAMPRVEKRHYSSLIIAYLEAAQPRRIGLIDVMCQRCGHYIPAV